MLRIEPKQFTLFSASVYARIPENHILKRLEQTIDFSFINELLADGYYKGLWPSCQRTWAANATPISKSTYITYPMSRS